MRIDGVVVLYNPDVEVCQNISKYIAGLNRLYVVDNSKDINEEIAYSIKSLSPKKIVYLARRKNVGLASALNIGINAAYKSGAEWVLMMNQDSSIDEFNLGLMEDYIKNINSNKIAWISARYEMPGERFVPRQTESNSYLEIISGSIINTEIYKKAGPFINNFYMDVIDHEYTLRLNKLGYKVVKLNYVEFKHKLGNTRLENGVIIHDYSPMRYYLITRNKLLLNSMYRHDFPEICSDLTLAIYKNWFVMAFREKDTWAKIRAIIAGCLAYIRGV